MAYSIICRTKKLSCYNKILLCTWEMNSFYKHLLKIYEENTKVNHNRVRSIYVIKIHLPLYVKKKFNFFGLLKINSKLSS